MQMQDAASIATDGGAGRLYRWLPALLLLVLGIWLVPLAHTCQLGCVPGDLGDARFNGVMLEHVHRWLRGWDASLISPPFFHPMPGAAAFSDNHWGTAWIYAAYRWLGADRYQAFDLWYLTGFVANFVVSHVVFRRMKFSPLASAIAAFAFTFAMPVISKHGHAQLTYRFLVPVGLLLWQRCIDDGRWRWLAAVSAVVVLQFYMSIYLGYFLMLLLAAWLAADCLLQRRWPWQWLVCWQAQRRPGSNGEFALSLVVLGVAGAGLVVLMYPYLHYSTLYGFRRGLGEIASMTPRPQSYLIADQSQIWGGLSARIGTGIPVRQEHQLFFGAGMLGLAVIGAVRARARLRWHALVSLGLLVLLTLSFGRYSLYLALAALPGVGAVRVMARMALVMALPLALLVAMAVDRFPRERIGGKLLLGVLVLLMGAESVMHRTNSFSMAEARQRTAAVARQLPAVLPGDAVLFNPTRMDEPYYVSELDGVILAQERGRPTLNGYSGNFPPGYVAQPEMTPCEQAAIRLAAAAAFHARHPQVRLQAEVPATATVAGQGGCPAKP